MLAWWLNLDHITVEVNVSDVLNLALSETSALDRGQTESAPAGGFYGAYDRFLAERRRAARKRKEDEEEAQRLKDAVEREIASFLHAQEALDAERAELDRLGSLVRQFADREAEIAFNERVSAAFSRAAAQQNLSALLALDRELQRQFEEEEMAVLMALALDD